MWNPFRRKPAKPADPILHALGTDHVCPDCRGESFNMGPQGGMSQNIKCANPECGSEFCVGPFEDGQWLDIPFMAERTNRSETDSIAIWGRGYGPLHPKEEPVAQ